MRSFNFTTCFHGLGESDREARYRRGKEFAKEHGCIIRRAGDDVIFEVRDQVDDTEYGPLPSQERIN